MIRIVASDMDGTFIPYGQGIPPENIEAVRMLNEKGITFVAASGRDANGIAMLLKPYCLRYEAILANGGMYADEEGNILRASYMDKKAVAGIIEVLQKRQLSAMFVTTQGVMTLMTPGKADEVMKRRMIRLLGMREKDFEPGARIGPSPAGHMKHISDPEGFIESDVQIFKAECFDMTEQQMAEAALDLAKIEGIVFHSSTVENFEINGVDTQKGYVLADIAKERGISREEVMVIGDGLNDLSMFEMFPYSFAMGDGMEPVRKKARFVTAAAAEGGFAQAVRMMLEQQE